MNRTVTENVNIGETSDKNITKGCSSYNYENGTCKDTNKPCDACYSCIVNSTYN